METVLVHAGDTGLVGWDTLAGLSYLPEVIKKESEKDLLDHIDSMPWCLDLKRRVQHYGYKYDYTSKRIASSMKTDPIPAFISRHLWKIANDFFIDKEPDQVIVNEYQVGQKIAPHIDCVPCFEDTIVSFSLGSPTTMILEHVENHEKVKLELQPRSILVLKDKARYDWKHGIPNQIDGRRVSITWRKVIL